MRIIIKAFPELGTQALYEVLQLRSEVFVVEQDCVYLDPDGKDQKAFHVLGYYNSDLVAYTRIFAPGDYFDVVAVVRVVVRKNFRGENHGHTIMEASLQFIKAHFPEADIQLSAQQYLVNFYQNHGFKTIGEGYLEDGIPHIAMIREGISAK